MNKMLLAAGAALAFFSTASIASVTYDDAGYGFVGKGDVQTAYGWNNATAQKQQNSVSFYLKDEASYDVTCEWETVTGGKKSKTIVHTVTKHKTVINTAALDATSKKTGQYTGWFLNGAVEEFTPVTVPAVGDSCPQGGGNSSSDPEENDAVVTAVDLLSGGDGADLYARHTTLGDRLLPLTPVITTTL
jgi:hypothetical protein